MGRIWRVEPTPGLVVILGLVISLPMLLHPTSFFSSPAVMDYYFGGETTPGAWRWPHTWSWDLEPFRYRILFHAAVDLLAEAFDLVAPRSLATYWVALLAGCAASIAFALWAADRFLAAAGQAPWPRFLLLLAWIAIPPFHLAFADPVQTKEDFLAYGLLFLGLRAILRGDDLSVAVLTLLGVLTRETLLILPGVYLLASAAPLWRRYGLVIAAILGHVAIRQVMGSEGYQVTRPENFQSAILTIIAVFFIFGFAWLALLPALAPGRLIAGAKSALLALVSRGEGETLDRIRLAGPAVLALLLLTHLFMGRILEIRITALAAPWALLAIAPYITWPLNGRTVLFAGAAAALAAAAVFAAHMAGAHLALEAAAETRIHFFAYTIWIGENYLQAMLLAALAVFMWRGRLAPGGGAARLGAK